MPEKTACRGCGAPLELSFVDLGTSPLSNAFLRTDQLAEPELHRPLHVRVCERCLLVQLPAFDPPSAIFDAHYAYFSSYSETWLAHARAYANAMIGRLALGPTSLVVEIASNDGYLLRWFAERGVPVLGVEPTANTAEAARKLGIETEIDFFGERLARELVERGRQADLLVANNVLAHVPDLHDFVEGFRLLLRPKGVATFEFPHLLQLIRHTQFDTIYHEHFSYLSLFVVERVFADHGLRVFDVEALTTHGGSLRVFAGHASGSRATSASVEALREQERGAGLHTLSGYRGFRSEVQRVKNDLLEFLIGAARAGKRVAGYGAPAKATTLLNFCGIRSDLLPFTVDRSPHKQGLHMPGVRIPVFGPEHIDRVRPDYLMILPWNLKDEIMQQMARIRDWGGRFVVPIPHLEIL